MSGNNLSFGNTNVGTSAAVIVTARTVGKGYVIKNTHATQTLFLGDSTVTTSNGFPLGPGESVTVDGYVGPLYGVGSAATTTFAYFGAY